jgi:hypothetical protein
VLGREKKKSYKAKSYSRRMHANLFVPFFNYEFVPTKVCGDFLRVNLILLLMSLVCCLWL